MKLKLFESPEYISRDLTLLEALWGSCIWRRRLKERSASTLFAGIVSNAIAMGDNFGSRTVAHFQNFLRSNVASVISFAMSK